MKSTLFTLLLASFPLISCSAKNTGTPPEIGNVNWQRSYPSALTEAKKSNKPIFALFQEVPG